MRKLMLMAACVMAAPSSAAPAPSEIEIPPDGRVDGAVNGRPMHFFVSPQGSKVPLLNPDAAQRVGLSPGWLNFAAKIGPVTVVGHSGVVRYTAPGTALRRRIGWFERAVAPGFDGMMGPGALSAPVITFRLRPTRAGEQVSRLPLINQGYGGMYTAITVGGERILVGWRLDLEDSIATAAAGQILRANFNGRWSGPLVQRPIFLGVSRPLREMNFEQAIQLGRLRVSGLLLRSSEQDASSTDPDEIIVTAKGKPRGPALISLGRADMAHCSTLSFDKARKEIRLSCL